MNFMLSMEFLDRAAPKSHRVRSKGKLKPATVPPIGRAIRTGGRMGRGKRGRTRAMFRGRRGPKPVQKKIKPQRRPGADYSVVVHQLPAELEPLQEALVEVFEIDPGLAKDALRKIPVALGDQLTIEEAKKVCKVLEKTKANLRVWNGQSAKQQYRFMDFRLPLNDGRLDEPAAE